MVAVAATFFGLVAVRVGPRICRGAAVVKILMAKAQWRRLRPALRLFPSVSHPLRVAPLPSVVAYHHNVFRQALHLPGMLLSLCRSIPITTTDSSFRVTPVPPPSWPSQRPTTSTLTLSTPSLPRVSLQSTSSSTSSARSPPSRALTATSSLSASPLPSTVCFCPGQDSPPALPDAT